MPALSIVVLGRSITSSWGSGHTSTYRALLGALARRGHDIVFLEREVPHLNEHRNLPHPTFCRTYSYTSLDDLRGRFTGRIASADVVIIGSQVPQGMAAGRFVLETAKGITAFYDMDTPTTIANLLRGSCPYLSIKQIPSYELYLSCSSGPVLEQLERNFGSPMPCALHHCVDVNLHVPVKCHAHWDLGYLANYVPDRQPPLRKFMFEAAIRWPRGRFVTAGSQYPDDIHWPGNVDRIKHVPPDEHARFYCSQRFSLNITRADMRVVGHSPSARLFEAAACAVPVISDTWPGLDACFAPGKELMTADTTEDVLELLHDMPDEQRAAIGHAARRRVLAEHTGDHRAAQLEEFLATVNSPRSHLQTHR